MDEETKISIFEDKNETVIYCDESDKQIHIVKRSGRAAAKKPNPVRPMTESYMGFG